MILEALVHIFPYIYRHMTEIEKKKMINCSPNQFTQPNRKN